jgi:predicted RNA-binding Zn-ribbon protein involved in translation (DUF1610 family)
MKTATAKAVAWDLTCPECGITGYVEHPDTGSLDWLEPATEPTAQCLSCGATVRVPKALRRDA